MDDFDWSIPGVDDEAPRAVPRRRDPPPQERDAEPAPEPRWNFALRDEEETPFQQLTRHWMNERHAPDILPVQEMLLGRLLDHIRKQVRSLCFCSAWRYTKSV